MAISGSAQEACVLSQYKKDTVVGSNISAIILIII